MKRLLMKTAMVSAAAVAATLVPLAGTSYAAGCSNAGCDNLGPVSQGCDADAVTQRSVTDGERKAELRWSSKCQAAWVRVTDTDGSGSDWIPKYGYIEKHNGVNGPLIRSLAVAIPNPGSDWSNMLGGNYYYRVCTTQGGSGATICSSYF
ncbi:YjfA family protein [Streptomyces sp. NBC_00435]|uniref:DUF2690 domain-containing protein n=1 Tax=Streptomyces sp. NBC_00435 TaxID=2903649 RepID=UPI002E1DA5D3